MEIVACDESGNTGANLMDASQPVFVLASVLASDRVAELASCATGELKFSKLKKSRKGRETILRILDSDHLLQDNVLISVFHKKFMAVTKIVDLLYEPLLHSQGIDLYENGANLATANLLYSILPVFVGEEIFNDIISAFVAMIAGCGDESIRNFYEAVERAVTHPNGAEMDVELGILMATYGIAQQYRESFHASDLDPAIPAFTQHASEWTRLLNRPFAIVHDESKPIFNEQVVLEAMMETGAEVSVLGYDRRKFAFPFTATGIEFRDSIDVPAVQIADVVAGSVGHWLRHVANGTSDTLSDELRATRLLSKSIMPVWPGTDVTPADLGTEGGVPPEDPHLAVGENVKSRLGEIPPAGQRRKKVAE